MRLPKTYFENLSAAKYHEYLKLLPNMEHENTSIFITLALTFAALSFFGIFAINPTLSTIFDLKKQLADNKAVEKQLSTKINNLSSLQQQYTQLGPDLPIVFAAIPKKADAPLLTAQVAALAQKEKVTITTYRVAEVLLASNKQAASKTTSYIFTLQASGNYDDMINFASSLARLNRVVTVESMNIGKDPKAGQLLLTIRGRQYFKP
jgi:Tfp pilus assembly protein PilO